MRKKREAKDEKEEEEEEKKKRIELRKAAAQAWFSHSQTSKRSFSEFELQRKHGFVKGKASRFKTEALSSGGTTKHHHHHHRTSFLDWEFGQSLWDSYEIVSVSKKLERELTLEEQDTSSCSYIGLKKKKRNSLRSLFSRSSSGRFKEPHDVTPSNLRDLYRERVSIGGKIAMEWSKQSLSLENRVGSSSSAHNTSKGKQIVQGQGEVFTHFVSFPLAIYPELRKKLEAFRNSVLGDNDNKGTTTLDEMGIDKSIFVSPNTLHLTVVMLKLENKESVDAALEILKSISSTVRHALDNRPVFIRLTGLDCMNGSLDKTRVLYAPVEEVGNEGRLLSACHVIIDAFANAGFAGKDAKSRLKLHATVMNASYRRGGKSTFDAREIHKEFGNKDWGKYLIREAQISKRSWYDANGYFHCCGSLPFPHE